METDTAIMDRNRPEFVVLCIEKIAAIYTCLRGQDYLRQRGKSLVPRGALALGKDPSCSWRICFLHRYGAFSAMQHQQTEKGAVKAACFLQGRFRIGAAQHQMEHFI